MEKMKTRSAKRITEFKTVAAKAVKVLSTPVISKKTEDKKIKKSISAEELQRRIEHKAYELYVQRGYVGGNESGDWFDAEKLVKAELGLL